MKSEKHKTRLGLLMVAAVASLLIACATEEDNLTLEESITTEVTGEELTIKTATLAESSAIEAAPAPGPCRQVTASSIPVFTTPTSNDVRCRFLRGDIFSYVATFRGRYETWCPRRTPPEQGVFSWAPEAGSVPVRCPF